MPTFPTSRDIGNNYKPDPAIGGSLPTIGPTIGAAINVDGVVIRPREIRWEPPKMIGRAVTGNPFYQGKPVLVCSWENMDLGRFHEIAAVFTAKMLQEGGPVVTLIWPNPFTAGVYESANAFMEYPTWVWSDLYLHGVEIRFSRFGIRPEEMAEILG